MVNNESTLISALLPSIHLIRHSFKHQFKTWGTTCLPTCLQQRVQQPKELPWGLHNRGITQLLLQGLTASLQAMPPLVASGEMSTSSRPPSMKASWMTVISYLCAQICPVLENCSCSVNASTKPGLLALKSYGFCIALRTFGLPNVPTAQNLHQNGAPLVVISAPSPHPEHHSRWTSKVGQSILPWDIPRQLLAMGILLPTMKVSFGHSGSKHVQNSLGSSGQTIYMLCLYTRVIPVASKLVDECGRLDR